MIYDTHSHPHLGEYAGDRDRVLGRCLAEGIGTIAVGTNLQESQVAVELADRWSNVWASVGLHPGGVFDEAFNPSAYRKLFGPRVVAVGETGLDYFHTEEASVSLDELAAKQAEVLKAHILLARQRDVPLILHIRNGKPGGRTTAYADAFAILRRHRWSRGVVHCFGGTLDEARMFVNFGYHIGFTANITYPRSEALREIAAALPLDRILVETDSPFLAPQSLRGQRNEPANVAEVIRALAEVRGLGYVEAAEATAQNARALFGLPR